MNKNKQKVDIVDVCIDATCITGALRGLYDFANDRVSSTDNIGRDDLTTLQGMIAALVALAEKHEGTVTQLENEG